MRILDRLGALGRMWSERRRRATAEGGGGSRATVWLAGLLVLLLAGVGWSLWFLRPASPGTERTLDALLELASAGEVERAVFLDEDSRVAAELDDGTLVWTAYPRNDPTATTLIEELAGTGTRVRVEAQTEKGSVRVVLTVLLPLVILAVLFALFLTATRREGSGLGEVEGFGTLGGRRRGVGPGATFADVAGADEAVEELSEVVDYLASPEQYEEMGAVPPKGVLLFGPPGCGKTLLARAVAGEAGVPFFSVAGAEFVESLVGVGAARVRDLFRRVRAVAPAIVFIDEIDAAGRRRGSEGGGSDEREQTLTQLLVEMDGFEVAAGIVVVAATNRPDILDPALLRPGRFDRHVMVDLPDLERRRAILELHAAGKHLAPDVDLGAVAAQTPGFSGADLANVVNEATLLAIRSGASRVSAGALSEAVQRVLAGPQRRGHLLTPDERHRLAVHEAGHALVAAASGRGRDIHRVSIVARSRGLGETALRRVEEPSVVTAELLRDRLAELLAGRAAEELVTGASSTAADDDLEEASRLVLRYVGQWGFGGRVGPRRLFGREGDSHLGDGGSLVTLGPALQDAVDADCTEVLEEGRRRAAEILEERQDALEALVARLLAEETLEGRELVELLDGVQPSAAGGTRARSGARRRPAARTRG